MIWASTKELYAMFLESDWWHELSKRKKASVGRKCEKCGARKRLTSHHLRYPANWFDTVAADLKVLCWPCHQKTHPDKALCQPKKVPKPARERSSLKQIQTERSRGLITRQEFLARKRELRVAQKNGDRSRQKKQRVPYGAEYDPSSPWHIGIYEGITPKQVLAQIGSAP